MRSDSSCKGRAFAPQRLLQRSLVALLLVLSAGCISFPRKEVEWPGRIVLPTTFESVWFRAESRPLFAYSESGTLTIDDAAVSFAGGDMPLNIPFREVKAVRWGKMKGDSYNDWAIVEYREAGATKTAAFMESWGGDDSDKMYSALKYAAEVRNRVAPVVTAPAHVASGWIKFTGDQIMALSKDNVPMVVTFKSKAHDRIWTRVTSDAPGLLSRKSEVGELGPSEKQTFSCQVLKIVADDVYLIDVRIYSDAARKNLVERISTGPKMSPADAAAFEYLRQKQ